MMTNFEFTRVLVTEHQRELELAANRSRLARLVRRSRRTESPAPAPVPMRATEPTPEPAAESPVDQPAAAA
ncbi:MAG: hypothetical protein ACRD29_22450 [Acidimicrobiales bacterium]